MELERESYRIHGVEALIKQVVELTKLGFEYVEDSARQNGSAFVFEMQEPFMFYHNGEEKVVQLDLFEDQGESTEEEETIEPQDGRFLDKLTPLDEQEGLNEETSEETDTNVPVEDQKPVEETTEAPKKRGRKKKTEE